MSKRRGCVNDPNLFCYICGNYVPSVQQQNITSFVRKVYYAYFGMKLGDQDKPWAPHKVCRTCVSSLREWSIGKQKSLSFGVPMVWREPNGHGKECYFCSCVVSGFNTKNKHKIQYPNLSSAIRPIPHGPSVPVPLPSKVLKPVSDSVCEESSSDSQLTECSDNEHDDDQHPQQFSQAELNDLVRDLNLSKRCAHILGSRLKEKRVLNIDTTFAWYKHHESSFVVKSGFAQMAKGGLVMDVIDADQARVAEEAGACAVMALERVPADIRKFGGIARMSDPKLIKEIMAQVSIPVMAKARIGHFAEAQILESLGVDMIDESEVLTMADEENHIEKTKFKTPFVCGARNLGEALRRIAEGAAMIRTKGEAGTGNVVEAVRHARAINREIRKAQNMSSEELYSFAKEIQAPIDLVKKTAELGRLPVVNFAAGGLATPADVSLLMQLGVDGVFVGSGIFKSSCPEKRAKAMVKAVTHYKDPATLASLSEDLGEPMVGINCDNMKEVWAGREGKTD